MAEEKNVNKIILGNETLIDLTGDTVTSENLLYGVTAHNRSGNAITGSVSVPIVKYGTCSTAAATAAKEINLENNVGWSLTTGAIIKIKFTYTNTASNPTLNVNNTGAKNIEYNGSVITTTNNLEMAGTADLIITYIYDGTNYVWDGWSKDVSGNGSGGQSYSVATTSSDGLMSSTDKSKLDGIESEAEVNNIDSITIDGITLVPDANKAVNIVAATNAEIDAIVGIANYTGTGNFWNSVDTNNAGVHNCLYRGKYLGSLVTDEQWVSIAAGTFDDLYIGDYWTINNINWRIAAFDYWLGTGDSVCTTHHIVIVPDTTLYTARMNATDTASTGYATCEMRTTNLANAKTIISSAFGVNHILSYRSKFSNAVSNGSASAGAWYNSDIELMTPAMITEQDTRSNEMDLGIDSHIMPLFIYNRGFIIPESYTDYWLRSVATAKNFVRWAVTANVISSMTASSSDIGVRPVFGICAENLSANS